MAQVLLRDALLITTFTATYHLQATSIGGEREIPYLSFPRSTFNDNNAAFS